MTKQVTWQELEQVFASEPKRILAKRQKSFMALDQVNYPKIGKINVEKFNFSNLQPSFKTLTVMNQLDESVKPFIEDETNIIVIKDGNLIYKNLDDNFNKIVIKTYFDAIEENDESVIDLLMGDLDQLNDHKLLAMNRAYRNSGLCIEIPKNVVVKETLKIHLIASNDLFHKTVVIAGQNSEFTLLEKLDNLGSGQFNYLSHVDVLDNAKLNYLGIDRLNEKTSAYIERTADVYRDGNLIYALGQVNDGHTISNNYVNLVGENAHCESRNVLFTDHESIHAVKVQIEHLAERSVAQIINHGIVKDSGHLHIDGIGKIHKGMKHSDAQQSTQIITLSDTAKVEANPYLLIDEYDVFAGHGAGIGQVDPEQLYYMMSRGMSKREAEKLIIIGFLSPIMEMIDSDPIKDDFIKVITQKLSL